MSRNYPKPGFPRLQGGHPLADGLVAAYMMADVGGPTLRDVAGTLDGAISGATWNAGAAGRVLSFAGASDRVALGTNDALNLISEFTFALRIRSTNQAGLAILLSHRQTSLNFPYVLGINVNILRLYANAGSSDVAASAATTIPLNVWKSIVVTRKGTQINWYLDGVADSSNPGTLAQGVGASATTTYIGAQDFGSGLAHFFTGDIEYLYVYRRALSAKEAAALHDDPYAFARPRRNVLRLTRADNAPVAQLTQAAEAAFPDRPVTGGIGLKVSMQSGAGGRYLEHDLGGDKTVLHTRFMVNPASAAGGWVTLVRGFSAAGAETFTLRLHGSSRTVRLTSKFGGNLEAVLPAGLAWHCVEARADAGTGDATLWLNGCLVGTVPGAVLAVSTRRVRIGCVLKQADVTGDLYLDEWIMADGYIGPVRVEPLGAHADDPARWLVLYNVNAPDSVQWAQWYRDIRRVPYANLLGLFLPTAEEVTQADVTAMQTALQQYLTQNGLDQQVMGVLCGHGVPGSYLTGAGAINAVVSPLQVAATGNLSLDNPLFAGGSSVRPTCSHLAGTRLTARIDGATLGESKAVTERALAIESQPLAAADAAICVDPYTSGDLVTSPLSAAMVAWATGIQRQFLRLPVVLPDSTLGPEADFSEISGEAFFWGWRTATPPAGFFASPAGRRVFLTQLDCNAPIVASLRTSEGTWGRRALEAGYAAVAGARINTSASATPRIERFFAALAQGWTLAEAWSVCTPLVRANMVLVGDPLMRVAFPRAGWNIYGPFDSWPSVDGSSPIAALREEERASDIPQSARVADGSSGVYLIRHVDDAGREERGARHVRLQNVGGQLLCLPVGPLSPSIGGWPVAEEEGAWRIIAVWARPLGELRIREVQLIAEVQGAAATTIATAEPVVGQSRSVQWAIPVSGTPHRFAIRAVGVDGGTGQTPWSRWMVSEPVAVREVSLVEGNEP